MEMNEGDPIRKRTDGTVLTLDLALRLNEFAVVIPGETRLDDLIEIKSFQAVESHVRKWFEALSTLDYSQRGQIIRTLSAFYRSGIETVEQIRELPNMDPKYIRGLIDIDHVRYGFAKQLFPVPQTNITR
ncbi:MAG: hypothetical protein NT149_01165 [Candidatus Gottesmanbacteria bacterium]|nr:hypothetical protein [Candidatus Gottesmanbacteria bacterium]